MGSIGYRFKGLGLCMLVLCVVGALGAGGAQGNWLVTQLPKNEIVLAKAHVVPELTIPSLNIEFRCTTLKNEKVELIVESDKAEGKVALSGCTAYSPANLKGVEQKNCKPTEPLIFNGSALLVLFSTTAEGVNANYILFKPPTDVIEGKEKVLPFTTITLPVLCALAETSPVAGSFIAECGILNPVNTFTGEDCSVTRVEHLLRPVTSKLFVDKAEVNDKLKFGENAPRSRALRRSN